MAMLITNHGVEYVLYFNILALIIMCYVTHQMEKHDKRLSEALGEPFVAGHWIAFIIVWFLTLFQWLVVGNNFWHMRIAMALGL